MKERLKVQAARIDALSLRERVILFVTVIAACMALVNVAWLAPAQSEHSELTQRFGKQSLELQRMRDELKAMPKLPDPNAAARAELAQGVARMETIDKEIKTLSVTDVGSAPLAQVLPHFLRRYEKLNLIRTATIPGSVPENQPSVGAAPMPSTPPGLSRQGLELTVAGPYFDLIRMVQTLEKAMPALRWGDMRLTADKVPPQLTLQVFVVGFQP